jgi:hypothetical protein
MTLEETYEEMPNGFHDAEVSLFAFNPPGETLEIDVDVWIGTMDDPPELRERYRRGRIRFTAVDCFAMPEPRAKPLQWTILDLEQEAYTPRETMYPLQNERERRLSAFKLWFGYSELSIAAESVEFHWLTDETTNRYPKKVD